MLKRHLTPLIVEALADTPVVFLGGARQTGKTTLARQLMPHYLTLDDPGVLAAVLADPRGFLAGLSEPVAIDEVQRAPELLGAIKLAVEEDRRPGRFLLTGSANVLTIPRVAESLVGRMELLTLWPLSQGELVGRAESLVERLFESGPWPQVPQDEVWERVLAGGFPEPVLTRQGHRRQAWFKAYLDTLILRDVRDLANIDGLSDLPRLARLGAARACQLLNLSELSRTSGILPSTLKRYLTLLETVYLFQTIPAWSSNLGKRLARAGKLVVTDSGLMGHLLGLDRRGLAADPNRGGAWLENFVAGELTRQLSWSQTRISLHHFRAHSGEEVDFILEAPDGRICGIEVKCTRSLGASDWKGLRFLADQLGSRFVGGVILYLGDSLIPARANLRALPLAALWSPD